MKERIKHHEDGELPVEGLSPRALVRFTLYVDKRLRLLRRSLIKTKTTLLLLGLLVTACGTSPYEQRPVGNGNQIVVPPDGNNQDSGEGSANTGNIPEYAEGTLFNPDTAFIYPKIEGTTTLKPDLYTQASQRLVELNRLHPNLNLGTDPNTNDPNIPDGFNMGNEAQARWYELIYAHEVGIPIESLPPQSTDAGNQETATSNETSNQQPGTTGSPPESYPINQIENQPFVYPYTPGLTATQILDMTIQRLRELGLDEKPFENDPNIVDGYAMSEAAQLQYNQWVEAGVNAGQSPVVSQPETPSYTAPTTTESSPQRPEVINAYEVVTLNYDHMPIAQRFSYRYESTYTKGTCLLVSLVPKLDANGSPVFDANGYAVFIGKGLTAGHVIDETTLVTVGSQISLSKPEDPSTVTLGGVVRYLSEQTIVRESYTATEEEARWDLGLFEFEVSRPVVNGKVVIPPQYGTNFGSALQLPVGTQLEFFGYKSETSGLPLEITITAPATGTGFVPNIGASTRAGLSGSPVIYEGMVVGFISTGNPTSELQDVTANIIGGSSEVRFIFAPAEHLSMFGYFQE